MKATDSAVHSFDEWTRLREVIVGDITGFRGFHFDSSFNLFYWDNVRSFLKERNYFKNNGSVPEWPTLDVEKRIIDELSDDLGDFVRALEGYGVKVRRPAPATGHPVIQTPLWSSTQSPALNVRDQTIILGDTILETAPHVRARIFENDYLKPLFLEYLGTGARWISMPRPTLSRQVLDRSYFALEADESEAVGDHHASAIEGLVTEIIFDGAQCIRLGSDVLVNVANRNHELGLKWLEGVFGEQFTFHPLVRMSDSHIDSIALPLRPGLWLLRDSRYRDFLPAKFRNWDYIVAPEAKADLFPSYKGTSLAIASKFIDMNILSLSSDTVVANSLFPELIQLLESAKFTVVPVRHRHRRLFGGGFHCFTLDIRRDGERVTY